MKKRTLAWLVVSSLFLAALVFASTEDAFPQKSHRLDSKTIRATTEIVIEAETASLKGPMKISSDGQAYGNLCLHGYKVNRRGWATLTFNIPREGDYIIWGRIKGRDGYSNSFFISVDGAPNLVWDVKKNNRWEWDRLSDRGAGSTNYPQVDPVTFHFSAGEHTLVIGNRERETLLDRLLITDDLERLYYPEPESWIQLDAPAMADVVEPGSTLEFKWRSQAISGLVNIDLSFDLGETFDVPVVQGTENDGSCLWQVPAHFNRAKVIARVADAAGGPYDDNNGYFAIVDPAVTSITLRTPVGGETVVPGSIYLIRWKELAFNGLTTIFASLDNGATWKVIADKKNAAGEYQWLVPDIPSEQCFIKVADSEDGQPFDVNDTPFTISTAITQHDAGASIGMTDQLTALPTTLALLQNYPNPFNPKTTLTFGIAESGHVKLSVYDALGRTVAVLVDGEMTPGWHHVAWNGADVPTGIYTAVLQSGSQKIMRRMSLVK